MEPELTELDSLLQEACDSQCIAGAVAHVIHRDQLVYSVAIGMMDMEARKPMLSETIFRVASMTKPITAVAVLLLQNEGHFGLDDPIAQFIPEFAQAPVFIGSDDGALQFVDREREITVRHLLTHTSGICLGAGGDEAVEVLWTEAIGEMMATPGVTLQSAVRTLAALPLASQPGTAWRYGLSFEALAALVEVVSGQWYDQFLQERVFEPLGMADTGYVIQPQNADRLSALYASDAKGGLTLLGAPAESPHVLFHGYESGSGWTTGGDGLVSTAADYGRFLQMLLNRGELDGVRLLMPETVAQMTVNQLLPQVLHAAALEPGYGQGLAVRTLLDSTLAGHVGSVGEFAHTGGHGTYFWVDPMQELIGLLMVQLNPVPVDLHQQFRALTYRGFANVIE